jgi:hypothetical protein
MDAATQGQPVLKMDTKRIFLAALILPLAVLVTAGEEEPRAGRIEFSDGSLVEGKISLTPGGELKIQSGSPIRALALARVREIRLSPEKEEMDRAWRFKEAGQTAKEFSGEPFPVRSLQTTVVLADGELITGHLYSTVLYVESGEKTQKVLLLAKQRGSEGQSLKSLVYPTRVSFEGAALAETATVILRLPSSELRPQPEVAVLTRGDLVRLTATAANQGHEFRMTSPSGREFFVALKTGERIKVGWPEEKDEKTMAQVRKALANSEDFFDARRLLGVIRDESAEEIYALLLAVRKGETTLAEARSQPWRLEIYRWKTEEGSERLMLAGQNYFFRGLGAKNEAAPAVELSGKLWHIRQDGETWTVGE